MHVRRTLIASLVVLPLALAGARALAGDQAGVPHANPKVAGVTVPTVLSPELAQIVSAQGSTPVENPTPAVRYYGYLNDQPNLLPALGSNVEASKTEPDKNTYLVRHDLKGADPDYDYGTHFLFQGHEAGAPGSITRINLDADSAHRVTVLANFEKDGTTPLPTIDGSTWYPWSERLLFSQDIGGSTVAGARLPNSFVFRFIPKSRHDLTLGGKLQALQVRSKAGPPIVFQTASALTPDIKDLHTYGNVFSTGWVTVHDTDTDGFAVFNANALAKARSATPFKRPENGQFRPGTGFREFYFDETGDTLHAQRNALDSAWLFDVDVDYSNPAHKPVRLMAQGRDPSATIDSGLQGTPGFQNDGDNEITGFHVSDGDPSTHGVLGAGHPRPFEDGWRVFYTGQHGDNVTWEIVRSAGRDDDENENEGHHGDHR